MTEETLFESAKPEKPLQEPGMDLGVKSAATWLRGFFFLFGFYCTLYGHRIPSGGFDGGIIVACTVILLMLAWGSHHAHMKLGKLVAWNLQGIGALLFFILIGIAVSFFPSGFSPGSMLFQAGLIPWINISIAITVGASLFMVFSILAELRVKEVAGKRILLSRTRKKR
jgi:multisubunit Na+/H+ antiporter MnhB subunit